MEPMPVAVPASQGNGCGPRVLPSVSSCTLLSLDPFP